MRILLLHPNYHSGGAEIAGNWPPAWVAYIGGALKAAGFADLRFIDAMTNHIDDRRMRTILATETPDVVLCTAITPAIYKAQELLRTVKELHPGCVTVLGGIHGTFMYRQVLDEAPWIDYVVRGEGEEIAVNLVRSLRAGTHRADRAQIRGLAFRDGDRVVATPAHPPIRDLDALTPDWSLLEWDKYIYIPLNVRVAVPSFARGCPFTCSFCSQWKFWRTYRVRDPKKFVDEIVELRDRHGVGFFILADEEPTINRKKFVALCEELIAREVNVPWGINTRVTDILRDEALLPLYRKAGLVHVSLGTEAAAQLKLDRFRKETTIEQNRRAVELLNQAGIFTEAQFIVGLENETPETLEETYEYARSWNCDMANWNMYTPWPFSDLFEQLSDKVEVRDYAKYNFVTPIVQPDAMDRDQLLRGVLRNYRRFYMRKALWEWPREKDPFKRKYLMGCLRAFLKGTVSRRFYDLGRINFWGQTSKVDFGFDQAKVLTPEQLVQLSRQREAESSVEAGGRPRRPGGHEFAMAGAACGGGREAGADASGLEAPVTGPGGQRPAG